MSITRHLAELIIAEHKYQPIHGEILLLGRQQVHMTPDEAQQLVSKLGVPRPPNAFIACDKMPNSKETISDASFFSLFSNAVVLACDVSDYEGAEIIFDLSAEIPSFLTSRFDFIYNGSVFDNVFDPAACIRNVSRMLKSDGRVLGYEGAAHASPAYLKFSPDWFFDYCAINGFADCQTFVATCEDVVRDPWQLYQFDAFTPEGNATWPMRLPAEALVIFIAQKGPDATADKTPIQAHYRPDAHAKYLNAFEVYKASPRRGVIRDLCGPAVVPSHNTSRSLLSKLVGKQTEITTQTITPGYFRLGALG